MIMGAESIFPRKDVVMSMSLNFNSGIGLCSKHTWSNDDTALP
jgi:hypothetical protein